MEQLNIDSIEAGATDPAQKNSIQLSLIPKPRRLHTLSSVATEVLPNTESLPTRPWPRPDASDETLEPVVRIGLDLVWTTQSRKAAPSRSRKDDIISLKHALAQTGVVASPLLGLLLKALKTTIAARLLQEVTLRGTICERPFASPAALTQAVVRHKITVPLLNGAWLERSEKVAPLLRTIARSLTGISVSADRRHEVTPSANSASLVHRWERVKQTIAALLDGLPDVDVENKTGLSEPEGRFLGILAALLRLDNERHGPSRIKPRLVDCIAQSSIEAAARLLEADSAQRTQGSAPSSGDDPSFDEQDITHTVDFAPFPTSADTSSAFTELLPCLSDEEQDDDGMLADAETALGGAEEEPHDPNSTWGLGMLASPVFVGRDFASLLPDHFQLDESPTIRDDCISSQSSNPAGGLAVAPRDGAAPLSPLLSFEDDGGGADSELEGMECDSFNPVAPASTGMPILDKEEDFWHGSQSHPLTEQELVYMHACDLVEADHSILLSDDEGPTALSVSDLQPIAIRSLSDSFMYMSE